MTKRAIDDYVYVDYARSLLDHLVEQGISSTEIADSAGIETALLESTDATLSCEQYGRLWDAAERLTGDDALGLHVGAVPRPGKYGILGYAMMSSATLQEALERQRRYQDLVGKVGHSALVCEADRACLQWHSHLAKLSRHVGEEHLASWHAFAGVLLGVENGPLAIDFFHARPDNIDEHERIFGCELRFDAPCNAIYFPRSYLDLSLRDKNPVLNSIVEDQAEKLLGALTPTPDKTLDRIRKRVCQRLIQGKPTIEEIAESLDTSPRTLQRQLSTAGWTFKDLLDDVRKKVAFHYMQQEGLSMLDVAFTLGFSEQSPFNRAFKRWTGQTPGQYRSQLMPQAQNPVN